MLVRLLNDAGDYILPGFCLAGTCFGNQNILMYALVIRDYDTYIAVLEITANNLFVGPFQDLHQGPFTTATPVNPDYVRQHPVAM